jgi:hypothetical protein
MKNVLMFALLVIGATSEAQDFIGYRNGNYTGVNSVFFNPANIADSRYKFDFNLFSVSTLVGNNQATFNLENLTETFDGDNIKNQIFGNNVGPASGIFSMNLNGPSFMFNVGKKNSFAVTTRARTMMNVIDMDGKLIHNVIDGFDYNDPTLPYTLSSNQNMRLKFNAWSEIGASYARILSNKGNHFFKGGVTVKYIGGAGNVFMNIDNLKGTLNADQVAMDGYLNNTTGRIGVGVAGIDISNFEASDALKMESTGLGADIGFVYEYRPNLDNGRKDQNKYKWKIGVSLSDVGSVKYDKDMTKSGAYDINITGNKRLYFNDFENVDLDDYNAYFKSRPQYFTAAGTNAESTVNVSLPTTLNIDVDYHLHKGFYVSASGQFALAGANKIINPQYYSGFSVTPRLEGKILGVYLPISYNELTKMNAGLSLRLGPLFVGSGSIITALVGDSKQVDVHVGLRMGILKKK